MTPTEISQAVRNLYGNATMMAGYDRHGFNFACGQVFLDESYEDTASIVEQGEPVVYDLANQDAQHIVEAMIDNAEGDNDMLALFSNADEYDTKLVQYTQDDCECWLLIYSA